MSERQSLSRLGATMNVPSGEVSAGGNMFALYVIAYSLKI
jgi:hypothetical protein